MTRRGAAALVALALLAGGCGDAPPPEPRFVIVGVDGADWDSALPLLRQGKLPALARLARDGARRTLRSLDGDRLSPTIWTTVATGVLPEEHGIHHFVTEVPGTGLAPVTSNQRQRAALWNILTARKRTVGVIGWLVTWPAEPVNGYMVSSYTPYVFSWGADRPIKGTFVDGLDNQVWPPGLQDELAALKVAPNSVSDAELVRRFTRRPLPDEPSPDARESLDGMRWSWASDATYLRILDYLEENPPGGRRPDLEMLYYASIDVVSHRFWKYKEPASYALGTVAPDEVARFGASIENSYRSVDGVLARVLAREAEPVRVLVLSDHGFRENRDPKRPSSSGWHRPEGLLLAAGRDVRRAAVLEPGSVVDVTPTVLYALGLPVADDMQGEPMWDLFRDGYRDGAPAERIASYEPEVAILREDAPVASPVDRQILERLDALGYIQR